MVLGPIIISIHPMRKLRPTEVKKPVQSHAMRSRRVQSEPRRQRTTLALYGYQGQLLPICVPLGLIWYVWEGGGVCCYRTLTILSKGL